MFQSFWDPVALSIQVAGLSTLVVLLLALVSGWWMARKTFPGKTFVETLVMLPLVLPPSVIGFIILFLLGRNSPLGSWIWDTFHFSIIFTFWGAVIAAAVVSFPLAYQTIKSGFQSIDPDLENVARSDGASGWQVFYLISLPLNMRFILSGATLGFARALGEFGATLMVAGNIPGRTQTVPTAIYIAVESGQWTWAWLWTLTMMTISFFMLWLVYRLQSKNH